MNAPNSGSRLADPLLVPKNGFVGGRIAPPPSKSYSHRALNIALLLGRRRQIDRLLDAEDTQLFRRALRAIGWSVEERSSELDAAVNVTLMPPEPSASHDREPVSVFCGNAGTMFRFLTASLCVAPGRYVLDGGERLRERPIAPLVQALSQLGASIRYLEEAGFAPLLIEGGCLPGGRCQLDAGASSQYLSALLMAGALAQENLEIEVQSLTSEPYVQVTLDALRQFSLDIAHPTTSGFLVEPAVQQGADQPQRLVVEADDSAAAYPAAAALISGAPTVVAGLRRESVQGDRKFLDVLRQMGGIFEWRSQDSVQVTGVVERPIHVDMSSMPDQVPTLAAVAAFAPGKTVITNVEHLRIKESDRLEAMATELAKVGVEVEELQDGLVVRGDASRREHWSPREDALIDPRADHRIAMSMALVGMQHGRVHIQDPTTVSKSYPAFWKHLFGLS